MHLHLTMEGETPDCSQGTVYETRRGRLLASFSGAVLPKSWAPLPVCYRKDDDVPIVCPKDDVKGKSTKDCPPEAWVECWKLGRGNGNEVNQAIQFVQKPNCGTNASFGVPTGGFVRVLQGCRMEADRPSHQPLNLVRS